MSISTYFPSWETQKCGDIPGFHSTTYYQIYGFDEMKKQNYDSWDHIKIKDL
jgi:hypothetical protein